MAEDHTDSESGNLLPQHGRLFSSKGSFIFIIPQTDNTYHGLCYTSRGALAGISNSSMGPLWRIAPWANALNMVIPLNALLGVNRKAMSYIWCHTISNEVTTFPSHSVIYYHILIIIIITKDKCCKNLNYE